MKKNLLTLVLALSGTVAFAQLEKDAELISKTCLRTEAGYGGGFTASAGVSRTWVMFIHGSSVSLYAAGQLSIGHPPFCYGGKVGLDFSAFWIGGGGLELKYLSNTEKQGLVLTPKLGLSFFSLYSLQYGCNLFPENRDLLPVLGRHQLTFIYNYYPKND